MLQTRWEHFNHLCRVSLQMLHETLRYLFTDLVVALPAELSPLLELCFFPIISRFAPTCSLFPRLEPEATRAVSEDLDLAFLDRSNLARSSPMSPSMGSGSFSHSIICRNKSYSSGKTWRNGRLFVFGDVAFSEYFFVPFLLSVCMESTSYVLSFRMVFFYLVTTGWIYASAYVRIQSIQIINLKRNSGGIP